MNVSVGGFGQNHGHYRERPGYPVRLDGVVIGKCWRDENYLWCGDLVMNGQRHELPGRMRGTSAEFAYYMAGRHVINNTLSRN